MEARRTLLPLVMVSQQRKQRVDNACRINSGRKYSLIVVLYLFFFGFLPLATSFCFSYGLFPLRLRVAFKRVQTQRNAQT